MEDKRQEALSIIQRMLPPETQAMMKPVIGEPLFCADLPEIAMGSIFEPLWTRSGIDLRTRSLITVAILIALRASNELAIHVPAAIRNGATVAEIEELIYHAAGYAGFPAAATARDVAEKALRGAGMIPATGGER